MQWLPMTTRSASCSSRPNNCTLIMAPAGTISFVPADGCESVGAAESGNAAGSLSHRIGRQRSSRLLVLRFNQTDQKILSTPDLAIDFNGKSG